MQLFLRVVAGRYQGQRIQLRAGQEARVGRTDWNDFSFPQDTGMHEGHFLVRCAHDGCWIRAASLEAETLVNGVKVQEARLRSGDRVRAGETDFAVMIEGDKEEEDDVSHGKTALGQGTSAAPAAEHIAEACVLLGLDPAVHELAKKHSTPEALITDLTESEDYATAIRLRAHWLPKREAVWWGCRCVAEGGPGSLAAEQSLAVQAALRWALDPSEKARRDSEVAAEACGLRGPGAFLALAAFWSEGSIAPDGMTPVPPDDKLTGQGVTAALIMAAHPPGSRDFVRRFRDFLALGKRIAEGEEKLPSKPPS